MKRIVLGLVGVLLLVVMSCSSAPKEAPPQPDFAPQAPIARQGQAGQSSFAQPPQGAAQDQAAANGAVDRMIVQTGQMQVVVEEVRAAVDRIAALAQSAGGHVVSSRVLREDRKLRGTISIRVPAGRFEDVSKSIAALAVEVTSQVSSSKDVTEEYTDLNSKLTNLEATRDQLLNILQRAQKIEDVLAVQRELSRVQGEIEQTKGRILFLERTTATSLIDVSLEQANLGLRFTADSARVKIGERVRFSGQISGGFAPYTYEWDFGDGDTSTAREPSHSYRSIGSYTISLKVTDDKGNSDTLVRRDYVTVIPGWSAGGIFGTAWNGLVLFSKALVSVLIWVIVFSPVWIVGGGILLWVRRRKKKA